MDRLESEGRDEHVKTPEQDATIRSARRPPLRPDLTVRQFGMDYPGCRDIVIRYGEPERGAGAFGHLEPLNKFAARAGVPLDQSMRGYRRGSTPKWCRTFRMRVWNRTSAERPQPAPSEPVWKTRPPAGRSQ